MKLIIWDFDGTLADTRPIIEAGMDHTLRALGLDPGIREEWLQCVGLPVEEGILRTFGPRGFEVAPVLLAYRSFRHQEHESLIKGFDGITELLAELKRRGLLQAIASSKRGEPLRRQVAALEWAAFLNPLVSPDEVAKAKPDPESIHLILAELGVEKTLEEARFLGVYEHFYPTNHLDRPGFGTHYVVLAYEVVSPVQDALLPMDQHGEYAWKTEAELLGSPEVHEHTKAYFTSAKAGG